VIRALLEILAGLLRFVPGFRDRKIARLERAWRENRRGIDADLAPRPWWVRDNPAAGDQDHRGG
jgi:hypothetical protein